MRSQGARTEVQSGTGMPFRRSFLEPFTMLIDTIWHLILTRIACVILPVTKQQNYFPKKLST